ncbi:unnamed protein product (macronuclear) [Paramecium tetraurelia]|uniref:Uncharacterized protein n=1 Tax=Paramecium tetraurelia TaxID=5888 RepID=A0DCG2_PARTE|nr:uncharacterized protein GSPATT00015607001 [Paramecium tetraurelia]CAK80729.1 unnamed protein product [Paramecium tetraurelia]|eukprot:XP_001448126.1 hypothetical protein (macronuclear) [Paramecium tetraurelia strain d4-2]
MNFNRGPRPSFSMPKQIESIKEEKPYSYVDIESTDCFRNEKIIKNVKFAPTITVFLRFQDEDIMKFKERLRKQILQTKETFDFNPSLDEPKKKGQLKSCLKTFSEWDSQQF